MIVPSKMFFRGKLKLWAQAAMWPWESPRAESPPNVLKALAAAKAKGLVTVALTGKFGSMLKEVSRYCLCVPSDQTPRIQESHILIGHIISQITEMELFAK